MEIILITRFWRVIKRLDLTDKLSPKHSHHNVNKDKLNYNYSEYIRR